MAYPPLDLVMTFVDGSDPAHRARRASFAPAEAGQRHQPGEQSIRYENVGEITYSVRSALRAMPWLGTIHVVTDKQMPPVDEELIRCGLVRVVDHAQIIPEDYRPVFSSTIIESFLYRIPGLSEFYLYNNDDFFHGGSIDPGEFLTPCTDGGGWLLNLRTVPGMVRVAIGKAAGLSPPFLPRANAYTSGIARSCRLLRGKCGVRWRNLVYPRHLTQIYRRSSAFRIESCFGPELDEARKRRFRCPEQISWSTLAYSLECHSGGARQGRYRPDPANRTDELFLDFGRYSRPADLEEAWRNVATTEAKFICLNNIPQSQGAAFRQAMAARGL